MLRNILLCLALFAQLVVGAEKFHLAIVGDRAGSPNQPVFSSIIADVERLHPDLVATVGDMSDNCLESEWELALGEFKKITAPIYYTPGNNDIVDDKTAELFTAKTGFSPYYSFDKEFAHFIVLDNSRYDQWEDMPKAQLDWLKADLAKLASNKDTYVFMHKPFWFDNRQAEKKDMLHELFKQYSVKAVFTGHWHQYCYEKIDGIDYYIIGSSGAGSGSSGDEYNTDFGFFYQFAWLTIEPGKYDLNLIKAGSSFDKQQTTFNETLALNSFSDKLFKLVKIEEGQNGEQVLQYNIKNSSNNPMKLNFTVANEENWKVDKNSDIVEIKPNSEVNWGVKLKQLTSFYPLPKIDFSYPLERKSIRAHFPAPLTRVAKLKNSSKVQIDGVIKDGEYGFQTSDFCDFDGKSNSCKTTLYISYDQEKLYIAVKNFQKEQPIANVTKRDEMVYLDDCAGLFLSQGKEMVYQFYINSLGNIWDVKTPTATWEQDLSWNGDWLVKPFKQDDGWGYEAAISLKELKFNPEQPIKFNFRRKEIATNKNALFSPVWGVNFSDFFGTLVK